MPMNECSICSDESRLSEVNRLLAEGKASFKEIASIIGCSKSAVGRHALHKEERGQAGKSSQARLYQRIERLLARAEKRKDWKLAEKLVSRLAGLQKQMPEEQEEPDAKPARVRNAQKRGFEITYTWDAPDKPGGFERWTREDAMAHAIDAAGWQSLLREVLARMPKTETAQREFLDILHDAFSEAEEKSTDDETTAVHYTSGSELTKRDTEPTDEKP